MKIFKRIPFVFSTYPDVKAETKRFEDMWQEMNIIPRMKEFIAELKELKLKARNRHVNFEL